ncbi:MAG: hypothetical protein P8J50_19540 [Acidimicrobiales bacterium]|nr:hypothetical protein [Acidimicrobiales bacterium]
MTTDFRSRLARDPRRVVTALIVGAVTLFVVWTMSPWAWFVDSTPTGGDMGAHVWSPKFLRDELLPNFRLTGWSPDWYAGFPAFTFYMVIPSLAIVMVNVGIEIESIGLDAGVYAFAAMVLAGREIPRRLGFDATIQRITMVFAAALNVAMSTTWEGTINQWIPGFGQLIVTYNDTPVDLAIAAIGLPLLVALKAGEAAQHLGRWRGVVVAAAAIATILIVPVPYGVAMKLVAISGIVTLPLAAFAAGRLGGLAYPGPAVLSAMTLPFLFDRSFNIYGGNVMSTMAGEFAYSIGLSIAVLYIGVAAKSMETGRHRMAAAALLALAGLTHLFAAFFALVATLALFLLRVGRREAVWLGTVGLMGGLLSAFWVLPFFWNRAYLNDMGWGKERDYIGGLWNRGDNFGGHTFLTNDLPLQLFVVLAVLGAIVCALRRVRLGMALALTAGIFAIAFILLPETRLWNVRILPFYYLCVYMLAGLGISEIARLVGDALRSHEAFRHGRPAWTPGLVGALLAIILIFSLGLPLRSLPGGSVFTNDEGAHEFGYETRIGDISTPALNLGPSWMRYNFTGYEARGDAYTEYSHLIAAMDRVGTQFGCGQSLWEYEGDRLGSYGTPMAPMLLPHWTDGCIGSMEGLYFEASATTPYHFLLQSELSLGPSQAMRDMPYSSLNVAKGVEGLQTMGVRYYMASTEAAITQARDVSTLTEIANSGPWVIFLVQDQALVVGLDHFPVVVDSAALGGEDWLVPTVAWWESGHDTALLADEGPEEWPRSAIDEILEDAEAEYLEVFEAERLAAIDAGLDEPQPRAEDRVRDMRTLAAQSDDWLPRVDAELAVVSNISTETDAIRFEVDRIGTPVLVRASYFPNWDVSGAEGPYRVAPNLMVVVPTDTTVELTYGRSGIELFSIALTAIGIVGAFLSRRWLRWTNDIPDEPLWDLAGNRIDVPARHDLIEDVRAGVIGHRELDEIGNEVDDQIRRGLFALGVTFILGGLTVVTWLHSRASDTINPGGDAVRDSVYVFGPGVLAIVVLFFAVLPALVDVLRIEVGVMNSARLVADVVNAEPTVEPPTAGERVDVDSDGEPSWSPPDDS